MAGDAPLHRSVLAIRSMETRLVRHCTSGVDARTRCHDSHAACPPMPCAGSSSLAPEAHQHVRDTPVRRAATVALQTTRWKPTSDFANESPAVSCATCQHLLGGRGMPPALFARASLLNAGARHHLRCCSDFSAPRTSGLEHHRDCLLVRRRFASSPEAACSNHGQKKGRVSPGPSGGDGANGGARVPVRTHFGHTIRGQR
jgi:hypothetical protein